MLPFWIWFYVIAVEVPHWVWVALEVAGLIFIPIGLYYVYKGIKS